MFFTLEKDNGMLAGIKGDQNRVGTILVAQFIIYIGGVDRHIPEVAVAIIW